MEPRAAGWRFQAVIVERLSRDCARCRPSTPRKLLTVVRQRAELLPLTTAPDRLAQNAFSPPCHIGAAASS